MRHISTRALIIKKRNFGEYHQFITLFSPQLGKFEAVARSSRKINSAFIGHTEVMNLCNIQMYVGNNNRYTLTQCEAQQTFQALRKDLALSMRALTMLEIFDRAVHSPEKGNELVNLLLESFQLLEEKSDPTGTGVETFKIKLLILTGSMPDISVCTHCHIRWQKDQKIILRGGTSLLCGLCAPTSSALCSSVFATANGGAPFLAAEQDLIIPFNIMKLIHYLGQTESKNAVPIHLTKEQQQSLKNLTRSFLREYLNIELSSEKVAASMQQEAQNSWGTSQKR